MTRKKQKKKPSQRSRRPQQPSQGNGLRVAIAVLFLGGFLLGSLLFLAQIRDHFHPLEQSPDARLLLDDVQVELESAMLRSGASLAELKKSQRGGLTEVHLTVKFPSPAVVDDLRQRLERLSPELELQVDQTNRSLSVLLQGTPHFLLVFAPPPAAAVPSRARIAIIMDDLGRDVQTARELLDLKLAVTMSILPNTPHASEVATLAHRYRREVMIHIPMEPLGYPAANPGQNALLVKLSDRQIRKRFTSYLEKIPYAVGGNNHMGSRFTADAGKMKPVLELMRREGLFFVDSRTSGKSVAAKEARALGVAVASRDIFLDNEADVGKISAQFRKLAALALQKGSAIGICHPHSQTLEALRQQADFLHKQGIEVVAASALVQR